MHPDPRNSVSWYLGRRSIYKGRWLMSNDLKRTALFEEHERLGGRLVPFAGYEMPVQYGTGIVTEHRAVRDAAGLFDVSRSEEHTSELQSRGHLVCRLLLEKKHTAEYPVLVLFISAYEIY